MLEIEKGTVVELKKIYYDDAFYGSTWLEGIKFEVIRAEKSDKTDDGEYLYMGEFICLEGKYRGEEYCFGYVLLEILDFSDNENIDRSDLNSLSGA